jgi:aryl-alcohol dehydrogenase-like predicted oxidoreductase
LREKKGLCDAAAMRRIRGRVVAVSWGIVWLTAWFGLAPAIGRMAEGIDWSLDSHWGPGLCAAALLAALVLTVLWVRGRGPAQGPGVARSRRSFLAGGAAALAGLAGGAAAVVWRNAGWAQIGRHIHERSVPRTASSPRGEWAGARVRAYRRLGRTGFEVSDISLGSGAIREDQGGEELAREAIDRGINYFDTAPDYSGASSERALGKAMRGRRERMFVATKFCTPDGHLPAGSSVDTYVRAVEASLGRLQTDYVDLVHVHSCDQIERLTDPNLHEAFAKLRQQGKARFLGFSSHTPNLEAITRTALDDGRFDVMMLAYHHGLWPDQSALIERAARADVAVVAMKTLKGAKHRGLLEFRDQADAYSQAAFKWVLSNPLVSCLVISIYQPSQLDEYLYASGQMLGADDRAVLERYDQLIAGRHCFAHCGACLASCPEGLPIADVLRHRMYFEDYGTQKLAIEQYARLERRADACLGCSAPCTGACPVGVPIQERMLGAHRLLTLTGA